MKAEGFWKMSHDERVDMARSDPDRFNQLRQDLVEQFISKAPEKKRERLRSLQWRIDAEIARHSNPLGACVAISRMMEEKVFGKDGLIESLYALNAATHGSPNTKAAEVAEETIVQFQPRKK